VYVYVSVLLHDPGAKCTLAEGIRGLASIPE
jgi:hypothetical protein